MYIQIDEMQSGIYVSPDVFLFCLCSIVLLYIILCCNCLRNRSINNQYETLLSNYHHIIQSIEEPQTTNQHEVIEVDCVDPE
jgi:hypothetical protein